MNDVEDAELGIDFVNSIAERMPEPVDDADQSADPPVVIGSLLFDRDGYLAAPRRPRVRASNIL